MDARRRRMRRMRRELTNLPNLITYGRLIAIPACLVLLARGDARSSFLAAVIYCVASATDYVDGYLARRLGMVSDVGKFLDPLADKLIVMAALVMMVHLGRVDAWVVVVMLAREMTITSLRSIASAEGMVISARFVGKMKTALQMVGLAFLMVHYDYRIHLGIFSADMDLHAVGLALLYVSLVCSIWSAVQYFASFIRHLAADDDA